MPEHAYNCSMVSVLQSPHPRVTWALDEGLQHGEGPSRRLLSHIAAPDATSARACLQPGEAYGTRITMEPTPRRFTTAGEAEEGTSAQLEKSELLRCPTLKGEEGAKTLCPSHAW
jgi:hypothetical protein